MCGRRWQSTRRFRAKKKSTQVAKHASFSSYAAAVLRRALRTAVGGAGGAGGGAGGEVGGEAGGEGLGQLVEELCDIDHDSVLAADLAAWHHPALYYALRCVLDGASGTDMRVHILYTTRNVLL